MKRNLAEVLTLEVQNLFNRKAKIACENSGQAASDHMVEADQMVELGSGAQRSVKTVICALGDVGLPEMA